MTRVTYYCASCALCNNTATRLARTAQFINYQLKYSGGEGRGYSTRTTLLWVARTEADMYLREELEALAAFTEGAFTFIPVVSRPGGGWTGLAGHLTREILVRALPRDVDAVAAAAGSAAARRRRIDRGRSTGGGGPGASPVGPSLAADTGANGSGGGSAVGAVATPPPAPQAGRTSGSRGEDHFKWRPAVLSQLDEGCVAEAGGGGAAGHAAAYKIFLAGPRGMMEATAGLLREMGQADADIVELGLNQ